MTFKENQRIEQIYFSNLKNTIDVLRRWKEGETDLKTADVLQALIDADSAILVMYKNLGEAYAETVSMIEEEKAGLVSLQAEFTDFKGEINAKIDEVNSYLLSLIRALEERVDELEGRVQNIEHELASTWKLKIGNIIHDDDQDENYIYDVIDPEIKYDYYSLLALIEDGYYILLTRSEMNYVYHLLNNDVVSRIEFFSISYNQDNQLFTLSYAYMYQDENFVELIDTHFSSYNDIYLPRALQFITAESVSPDHYIFICDGNTLEFDTIMAYIYSGYNLLVHVDDEIAHLAYYVPEDQIVFRTVPDMFTGNGHNYISQHRYVLSYTDGSDYIFNHTEFSITL